MRAPLHCQISFSEFTFKVHLSRSFSLRSKINHFFLTSFVKHENTFFVYQSPASRALFVFFRCSVAMRISTKLAPSHDIQFAHEIRLVSCCSWGYINASKWWTSHCAQPESRWICDVHFACELWMNYTAIKFRDKVMHPIESFLQFFDHILVMMEDTRRGCGMRAAD